MGIVNLIISILSLIATIAISFVIYFLERKNLRNQRTKEIKDETKKYYKKCWWNRIFALGNNCGRLKHMRINIFQYCMNYII